MDALASVECPTIPAEGLFKYHRTLQAVVSRRWRMGTCYVASQQQGHQQLTKPGWCNKLHGRQSRVLGMGNRSMFSCPCQGALNERVQGACTELCGCTP